MDKKLFSFIHAEEVHLAPGTKVIPAEDLSKLATSEDIIESSKKEVAQYRKEVEEECARLKEEEKKKGFDEGLKTFTEHLAALEKEIKDISKKVRDMIVPVALTAAKKIVGRELEGSVDTIVDIVKNSLQAVSHHKKITIYVNKSDLENLEKNKEKLKQNFDSLLSFNIRDREDVTPGGCIIETEAGIINAKLENQWDLLEKAFTDFFKKKQIE